MNRSHFYLVISLIAVFVFAATPVDLIAQGHSSNNISQEPARDPFKVLIKPPRRPQPPGPINPDVNPVKPQPKVPKLVINVTAIAGKPPHYVSIIKHKGKSYIVEDGSEPGDKSFKVRKIYSDKIEVFYNRDKTIKTFLF